MNILPPPMTGLEYQDIFYVSQLLRTQDGGAIKSGVESQIFSGFTDHMGGTARYLLKKGWNALGLSADKPGNLLDWGTETNQIMPQYFSTMNNISFSSTNNITAYNYMLNVVLVDNYKSAPVDFVGQMISYNIKRYPL